MTGKSGKTALPIFFDREKKDLRVYLLLWDLVLRHGRLSLETISLSARSPRILHKSGCGIAAGIRCPRH
jgi:hypothetical protein